MRISYIFFTFYLLCLSVTIQRNEVLTQEWQDFPSMALNDLSQDQQTYIILFLTHLVVALWVLICVYGTDILYWSPRGSLQDSLVNQDHSNESHTMNAVEMQETAEQLNNDNEEVDGEKMHATEHMDNDNEELNAAEMYATEQQLDNDEDELNDSYLSILVDCIRVMISQAANEQEARDIISQALSEEFPKYFHNDKVINCLLELNTSLGNGILLESKVNEADGEQNERKNSLLVEDVAASQEEDHEYISAITDEELISMISDILSNSCEEDDSGTPCSPLENHGASETPIHRPVSPMEEEENQEFEQGAKIDDTNEDESVEMSSSIPLLDQMHFLPDDMEDSCLGSTDQERDSLYPLCKGDLEGSLSWPSLPGESRVPSENESHHDTDAFFTAPRYAFSKPSCVITTSSCQSCKDAEHHLQNIELTPTHVLPTAARLSLSGLLQGSFSEVLSKLTHAKRSGYKRKTGTARELWSDSQEDDTSIFNASFSISSLEGMLSPESIPPSPSSPVFGSPEKSPHVLGIRLHKPAGFKDVFLSVVDHNKKTGLPRNISDTWTLGTREEMELILHVDTNPHQRTTKTYSGSYCLAFNDKSDLEEYLSNQDSQEDFGFSMLCSHDNSREERVSASDEECYESFLSCSNVDGVCCEEDQKVVMEISQANDLEDEKELSCDHIDKDEKHQKEDELLKTEKSDHGDIKPVGYKGATEKRQEEELPQDEKSDQDPEKCSAEKLHCSPRDQGRIFGFACLALTSYLAHRYLK